MRRSQVRCALVFGFVLAACADGQRGEVVDADAVTLTWLSVTNWLLEAGDVRVLLDGYVSRVDRTTVFQDGRSGARAPLDTAWVRQVGEVVLPAGRLDWVLVGHGHWDHAFDAPAWARLTGARIAGAASVCMQAHAHGIAQEQCRTVEGGESFALGRGVQVRVVRWHHSGDSTTLDGRRLRAPYELREAPVVDAAGGLRPGFLEDYPNGGGSRAYLITVRTRTGPVTLLWSNTGNAQAWDVPLPDDSALFRRERIDVSHLRFAGSERSTREHLAEAMREEGLESVDVWIGFAGAAHVAQVMAVLRPRVFVPHHWDDFWTPLVMGPGRSFAAGSVRTVAGEAGASLVVPAQYLDRLRVRSGGVELLDGESMRAALGVREYVATGSARD